MSFQLTMQKALFISVQKIFILIIFTHVTFKRGIYLLAIINNE